MTRCITLLMAAIASCCLSPCQAETRLALLIGNNKYSQELGGSLTTPIKDVERVAEALRQDGFSVRTVLNGTRPEILRAMSQFSRELGESSDNPIGFFYYSGHGVSRLTTQTNFIIPVDVQSLSREDVWWSLVSLDDIMDELKRNAPNAAHFVIFDACRNVLRVPFKNASKGFDVPGQRTGMFIGLATSPV
jgi:uncharacterized caspase-like protein